jgi:multiple antibiotic resistance protein
VSLGLLLLFAVGGGMILRTFGITIDAFRIAGGILFVVMSIKMLTGADKEAPDGEVSATADPAIFPLGMPIICGPGAISTVMVLMGQSASSLHVVSLLLAILAVTVVTAAFLIVSPAALRLVGRSGVHIVTQVIGLIVCVIGIQFIINGVRPVVLEILSSVR